MTAGFLYGAYALRYNYLEALFYDKTFSTLLSEVIRANDDFAMAFSLLFAIPSAQAICGFEYFQVGRLLIYFLLSGIAGSALTFVLAICDWRIGMNFFLLTPISLLAGFIYWSIAGRYAGLWRKPLA